VKFLKSDNLKKTKIKKRGKLMSLSCLKKKNIPLPEPETVDGLTAQDIIDKINSFTKRADLAGSQGEFMEADFIELLCDYPQSMCNHHLGDKLQLIITLIYLDGQPSAEDLQQYEQNLGECEKEQWRFNSKPEKPQPVFSYEHLRIMFDCSKASIHEAIKRKESQAKQLLSQASLKNQAKDIALQQFIEEEKQKLVETKQNNQRIEQTTEQTFT
jgi:hypothetical protein